MTDKELHEFIDETIDKITTKIPQMRFNTCVSDLMKLMNVLEKHPPVDVETKKRLVQLIAPFAPHLAEELWERLGGTYSVFDSGWHKKDI